MTFIIDILNPAHESVETLMPTYSGYAMHIDHTGRHLEPESLCEFLRDMEDITRRELSERSPGHTALIFDAIGNPFGVIDGDYD